MKTILKTTLLLLSLCTGIGAYSQLNMPRGSQKATVSQRVGISDITITYSRPSVNGREIWGQLVPYGFNNLGFGTSTAAPWRAGANENTTVTFSHDMSVEGQPVKAGTYGLHIAIHKGDKATVILSKDTNAWGSFFYDQANDVLRAEVTTKQVPHRELLTFEFNTVNANSTITSLVWEQKEIPFSIEVPVAGIVLDDFKNKSKGQLGFNRLNWENAARFALNNGGDLDDALHWINNAIAGQFYSQKNFNNLSIKALILKKQGNSEDFAKLIDEAASLANTGQLNTLGYQMLNAKEYDLALKFFKQNVKNNPTDANVHDSLGEAYKTIGDKENAIKYLKKSLSLNPPPNVKANSEKLLKELGAM